MNGAEVSQPAAGAEPLNPLQQFYRAQNQHNFSVQLEFVSSLANPSYVAFLAQNDYLNDKRFLRYLKHLHSTWSKPEYARFVRYPYGLYFLEALQTPSFRAAVAVEGWEARAKSQIISHWASWRKPQPSFSSAETGTQEQPPPDAAAQSGA